MANWNLPVITTSYTDTISEIKGRDLSAAKMDFSSDTNVPTDVVRYNTSDNSFERWNGSSWADLGFHALIAYLAENETVTGAWTFDGNTTFDGTAAFNDTASFSADMITTATEALLRSNTSDAGDSKSFAIASGGAFGVGRGAGFRANGNKHTTRPGMLELYGGNITGGDINLYVANAVKALAVQYATGNAVSEYEFRAKAGTSSNYASMTGLYISDSIAWNGNTAGASGVTIKSVSIPANTLSSNGQQLSVIAWGGFSASGSTNKRLRLRWAGVDIYDTGGVTIASKYWRMEARIIRSSASNASCFLQYSNGNAVIHVAQLDIATTFSNANTLAVLGGGTLADDVQAFMLQADYIPNSPN